MNSEIICEFQTPKTHTGETPTTTDFWNYQTMICEGTSTLETLIENASTGANFYLRQEISYGDILVIVFLILFLVFGILGFLVKFLIPKTITYFKR